MTKNDKKDESFIDEIIGSDDAGDADGNTPTVQDDTSQKGASQKRGSRKNTPRKKGGVLTAEEVIKGRRNSETSPVVPSSDEAPSHDSAASKLNPKVSQAEHITQILRAEEEAAKLVAQHGRYIPSVDDVSPGKVFQSNNHVYSNNENAVTSPEKIEGAVKVRSNGSVFYAKMPDIEGQKPPEAVSKEELSDPRSEHFITCRNKLCPYRDGCLRYRMVSQRTENQNVFYPSECREDGIYISIDDSDYKAYPPMKVLESSSTPNW